MTHPPPRDESAAAGMGSPLPVKPSWWPLLLGFTVVFFGLRILVLLVWGDFFFNPEDMRYLAAAQTFLHTYPTGSGSALPNPVFLYFPDYYSFGSLFVILGLTALLAAGAPAAMFTIRLVSLLLSFGCGLVLLRLLWRLRLRDAAWWFIPAYTLMPPTLMEINLSYPALHGGAALPATLFSYLLFRWLTAPPPERQRRALLLVLVAGLGALFLKSLFLLPLIALTAIFLRPADASRLQCGALLAVILAPLFLLRWQVPGHYERAVTLLAPAASSLKLMRFFGHDIPRITDGILLAIPAAALVLAGGTSLLTRNRRTWGWALLSFPALFIAIFFLTTIDFYSGARVSHTYKYCATLLPLGYFLLALAAGRRSGWWRLLLAIFVLGSTLRLVSMYSTGSVPADFRQSLFNSYPYEEFSGAHPTAPGAAGFEYGLFSADGAGIGRALATSAFLPDEVLRRDYLIGVGYQMFTNIRSQRPATGYTINLPHRYRAAIRTGYEYAARDAGGDAAPSFAANIRFAPPPERSPDG